VLKSRPSGLEKLLATWGIEVGQDVVLDPQNATAAGGADPKPVFPGSHPIVNSLGSARVHFLFPRSMHAVRSGRREEAKVEPLLFTGTKTELATDFNERQQARSQIAVPPQSLAVAVEKSIAGLERGATRIVAIGESSFWSNKMIDVDANRAFAAMTVNWLVQQNMLLNEIPRQAIRTYRLTMTNAEMSTSRWLLLAGMPGAVMLVGVVVWMRRRK
jgi:ABC-type uncharacterized transport system involved in gliding motility auxiliary subunit